MRAAVAGPWIYHRIRIPADPVAPADRFVLDLAVRHLVSAADLALPYLRYFFPGFGLDSAAVALGAAA